MSAAASASASSSSSGPNWRSARRRHRRPTTCPPDIRRKARFVKPELTIEVAFAGWTDEGYVRHAAFKGVRGDKPAAEVKREMPADPPANKRRSPQSPAVVSVDTRGDDGAVEIAGVRVTHPDRVVFAGQAITKRRLIDYYLSVKDLILPHVADRPLSLVRFPSGADGDGFFQKHASPGFPDAFKPITIREKEGKGQYLTIEDERGLVAAVQMGVLELHIWGAHNQHAGKAGPAGLRPRSGRGGGLRRRCATPPARCATG